MHEEDTPQVSEMLLRLFERYIAPDFSAADRSGIRQYLSESALRARLWSEHFTILAQHAHHSANPPDGGMTAGINSTKLLAGTIAGMIEVRNHKHITLLFVDEPYQGCGIGRALLEQAIDRCRNRFPHLTHITVNASPFAAPIYRHWGFSIDETAVKAARTAIPMILQLPSASTG
jgi:GNAT superfamily N-acetyltransferase